MPLTFYNTATKKVEPFEPMEPGKVRMYSCGPTVYGPAHIGNLSYFVFADLVKRLLVAHGYEVMHVMNITDIGHLVGDGDDGEDKMTVALKREGLPLTLEAMYGLATRYIEKFKVDTAQLNILPPSVLPRAADHVPEDIALVETLVKKGFTYTTKDGIYFDTEKMPSYGAFARLPKENLGEPHQRIINSEKKNSRDFALWKFSAPGRESIGYEAPFGKGFPGWHIECSAMSMKYLGDTFDIHTGGIDHIPVHHQNEIAQSECASGKPLAHFLLHRNLLSPDGEKLSKSLKNDIVLDEVLTQGVAPEALRLFFLSAHYRTPQNFTWDALYAADRAWRKMSAFFMQADDANTDDPGIVDQELYERFLAVMNNDLNTPEALAILWELFRSERPKAIKRATMLECDKLFGLGLDRIAPVAVPQEVLQKIKERNALRDQKNYPQADTIRDEVHALGFDIIDTESGSFPVPKK